MRVEHRGSREGVGGLWMDHRSMSGFGSETLVSWAYGATYLDAGSAGDPARVVGQSLVVTRHDDDPLYVPPIQVRTATNTRKQMSVLLERIRIQRFHWAP